MTKEKLYTEKEVYEILEKFASVVDDAYFGDIADSPLATREVDGFLDRINKEEKIVEKTIGFTFGHLKRVIRWEILHEIIGVGYYVQKEYGIDENEVFQIKESVAREYNLI